MEGHTMRIRKNIEPRRKPPIIGRDLGLVYPVLYRVLALRWWPSVYRLAHGNRLFIDIYVVCWLTIEIVFLSLMPSLQNLPSVILIVDIIVLYRLMEVALILLSFLTRTASQLRPDWASRSRTVILCLFNLVELFFIFAILYISLPLSSFNPQINRSFIDGIYFSVVAGITLGFGDIVPRSQLAKALVTTQPFITLTVFLTMISYARGSHSGATLEETDDPNSEQDHAK